MKRYVREFANDLKSLFTPMTHPLTRKCYCEEIDRIVEYCKRGKISDVEAIKALTKLML